MVADIEPEALLEKIERIPPDVRVRVTYDSERSDEPVERLGRTRPYDDVPLYVKTSEMKGDIVVNVWKTASGSRMGLNARSTQGPFGHGAALGELLDVEVLG